MLPRICELYVLTENPLPADACGTCFFDNQCPSDGNECTLDFCQGSGSPNAMCVNNDAPDGAPCTYGLCASGTCVEGTQFVDNGDGTVSDLSTGLMWEKKDNSGGIHDVDNLYSRDTICDSPGGTFGTCFPWDGTADTVFLATLNDVAGGGTNCFAGYCDWRIPQVDYVSGISFVGEPELESITVPFCAYVRCEQSAPDVAAFRRA